MFANSIKTLEVITLKRYNQDTGSILYVGFRLDVDRFEGGENKIEKEKFKLKYEK